MSVTKNHSPAIPIPRIGKVIDPAKQRVFNAIMYATIGTIIVVAAAIALSSFLGGSIPPANEPPVVIDTSKTEPTEKPTDSPTSEPTAEPTIEPTVAPTMEPTEPTNSPAGEPITEPTVTANPVSIPENFIVEDEYWEFSLFFHNPDGERINGGVFFSGFPEKLKLYAPMSGYLTVISGNNPFQHVVVYISEVADDVTKWDDFGPATGRYVTFTAQEIELLDAEVRDGSLYVEKGKPFAEVTKKADMFPDLYEEKVELMFIFDRNWADMLDVSIDDPREYVWSAIQKMEEVGD